MSVAADVNSSPSRSTRPSRQDVRAGLAYPDLHTRLNQVAQRLRAIVDEGLKDQGVGESDKKSSRDVKQGPQG